MEEKAKAYDLAIDRAKKWYYAPNIDKIPTYGNRIIEEIFPELKESGDERIRKFLHHTFTVQYLAKDGLGKWHGEPVSNILAWLEKQGEQTNFLPKIQVGDIFTRNEGGELIKISQLNMVAKKHKNQSGPNLIMAKSPQLGEQKAADEKNLKIEEGKWYVCISQFCNCIEGRAYKATSNSRIMDDFGTEYDMHNDAYKYFRLWTIQDAKNGDLIYVSTKVKGIQAIFHKFENGIIYFHCNLCSDFTQGGYEQFDGVEFVCPLPKTHYQRFFQKMHDAGFEWDAEKKELKKIEQKPDDDIETSDKYEGLTDFERTLADICIGWTGERLGWKQYVKDNADILLKFKQKPTWSEEDENEVAILEAYIRSGEWSESHIDRALGIVDELVNKYKSSKDRVQPKQEWSEGDNVRFTSTMQVLEYAKSIPDYNQFGIDDIDKNIDWLNSLKDKVGCEANCTTMWKPSEKQMDALQYVYKNCCPPLSDKLGWDSIKTLELMYQELKKLREK